MPESDVIFDPGYTTKPGHDGLGLGTVQRLLSVQRGAALTFERDEDRVQFVVTIPKGQSDAG